MEGSSIRTGRNFVKLFRNSLRSGSESGVLSHRQHNFGVVPAGVSKPNKELDTIQGKIVQIAKLTFAVRNIILYYVRTPLTSGAEPEYEVRMRRSRSCAKMGGHFFVWRGFYAIQ